MKKLSHSILTLAAVAIGALVFVQTTPVSFADHDSCSGTNYYSCITGGRAGVVGAGPGGSGGYYVNDPTPGGMCTCSGCLCVTGHDVVTSGTSGNTHTTGVASEVDIPSTGGTKNTTGSTAGTHPTTNVVNTIKITVTTASTCDSACRTDNFYKGFYDIPVFGNASGNTTIGGSVGTGATHNSSCVGMGCNVTGSSVTQINPIVDVVYKGIYPIQSLTEGSGPGTKTITQQEFDAKYGSYIQR